MQSLAAALAEPDPAQKVSLVYLLASQVSNNAVTFDQDCAPVAVPVGRPAQPLLVHPSKVPRRGIGSKVGHAALIHAVAHIEFNAINLALDAAHRFRQLPDDYYRDWIGVAAEEAKHFMLLRMHLQQMGYHYGDFNAHDGLWSMAEETAHDPLIRMALVPRVLEARGLDVTPQMRARLVQINDDEGVRILDVIASDEVGHVRIGTHWFRWLCADRGLAPDETFLSLLKENLRSWPKGPFARAARLSAGFSETEMQALELPRETDSELNRPR